MVWSARCKDATPDHWEAVSVVVDLLASDWILCG